MSNPISLDQFTISVSFNPFHFQWLKVSFLISPPWRSASPQASPTATSVLQFWKPSASGQGAGCRVVSSLLEDVEASGKMKLGYHVVVLTFDWILSMHWLILGVITCMGRSFKYVPVGEDSYIQSTVDYPMLYLSFITMNPIRNKYTASGQF